MKKNDQNQKKEGRGMVTKKNLTLLICCLMILVIAAPLWAEEGKHDNEAIAKLSQNPVANTISLPFQNNTFFNVGPTNSTMNILNIQPVVPISLGPDWFLLTRPVFPVTSMPDFGSGDGTQFGLGDIQLQLFLSPAHPKKVIWGVGPIIQLPTHTDDRLGSRQWGLGPTAVALTIDGPWVYGALVNNVWSLSGEDTGRNQKFNKFLVQPFGNYNFGKTGTYLCSSPFITADWRTGHWVVPVGGGIGQIFKVFGKQPVDTQIQAFYDVVNPDRVGPEWQLRFQVKLMFPD